ncbi:MAG TPA: dTMP kinase [Pirellulales bacterium]|nr:dTMP kinase [Pirellulales bacterium]
MFYSFDGIDGSGKSTQVRLFAEGLREHGREVVVCRDPGSTPLGDELRKLLLHRDDLNIARRAEMLLYMAARAQLVEQVIRPALEAGKVVVSDRFLLANVVYQGHAGGLDVPSLWQVGRVATGGLEPDLTFVLDIDDARAAERLARPLDRMERQGEAFRAALRAGYLAEAARHSQRMVVIDASGNVDEVQAEVRRAAGMA